MAAVLIVIVLAGTLFSMALPYLVTGFVGNSVEIIGVSVDNSLLFLIGLLFTVVIALIVVGSFTLIKGK